MAAPPFGTAQEPLLDKGEGWWRALGAKFAQDQESKAVRNPFGRHGLNGRSLLMLGHRHLRITTPLAGLLH